MTQHNITYDIHKVDRHIIGLKTAERLTQQAHTLSGSTLIYPTKLDIKKQKIALHFQTWQTQWKKSDKGRKTFKIINKVQFLNPALNWKTILLITGNGHMKDYYRRFGLKETDGKFKECNDIEDQKHI